MNGRTLAMRGHLQTRGYSCGFAAALTVLRALRPDVDPFDLYRRLGTGRDGTRQTAIVRELRAAGLRANVRYDVDFTKLCDAIESGKPVIGYLFDHEHWLVLYGYAVEPNRVFVCDSRPGEPALHSWESYGPRLGDFGIVCSQNRAVDSYESPEIAHDPNQLSLFSS